MRDPDDAEVDSHLVQARATIRGMTWLQVTANGLGIVVVALYFRFLAPSGEDRFLDNTLSLWVFGAYVGVMFLVALPLNAWLMTRAVSWAREQRSPTARERKLLFALPTLETLSALASWIGTIAAQTGGLGLILTS